MAVDNAPHEQGHGNGEHELGASPSIDFQDHPCQLIPPCKHGNHGTINMLTIGKYFFTEDALKHDLLALRKGEVYGEDDFYVRAKAWYKAEIDRLEHKRRVGEVNNTGRTPLACSSS